MTAEEKPQRTEIIAEEGVQAVIFTENGEHLLSGGRWQSVGKWSRDTDKQVAKIRAFDVHCLAASKKWIAAGGFYGDLSVWDAETYETVWRHKEDNWDIHAADFSPESTRLVSGSWNRTATVWDVASGKRVLTLDSKDSGVIGAKFSPEGERIATATPFGIQIWDSNNGRLLLKVPVKVTPHFNRGFVWFNDHLFVVSDNKIKQLDASTGSTVSEWSVPSSKATSCISLPRHGKFVVYATNHVVSLWHTSTHSQLGLIKQTRDINSIALSPDDRFFAIGRKDGKIIVEHLSRIVNSIPLSRLYPTLQEPEIQINHAALDAWKQDQLQDAESLLTTAIHERRHPRHHLLALRALVRARLKRWDEALVDTQLAIGIQPSVIAFIAKSVVHASKGERHTAYRACDIAIEHFHSSHVTFLLLIKAIVIFLAGKQIDAICRLDDLINMVPFDSTCYTVQAYMYLLLGDAHMGRCEYDSAAQSFERASTKIPHFANRPFLVVSLMTGWKFDDLDIMIQKRHCEALYAARRVLEASKSFLKMIDTGNEEVYTRTSLSPWISEFAQKCLGTLPSSADLDAATIQVTLASLVRVWAKVKLASCSWEQVLLSAADFVVLRFTLYRVMFDHLELHGRTMNAGECFHQMVHELLQQANIHDLDQSLWATAKLEMLGDTAISNEQYDDAISHYSAALRLNAVQQDGLLIKRCKAYMSSGSLEKALIDANEAIESDPLSPWGYEMKHAALHEAGDYENAIYAFTEMLLKMRQSPDPKIRALDRGYIYPFVTRDIIQNVVQDVIRDMPRVLVDTSSGRLCDKLEQAASLESLPIFNKLISSMTTHIDNVRVRENIAEHYRYAMFSHKWERGEPSFEKVTSTTVYDLEKSPTHDELRRFCETVRDAGLHWAWSDTCCINQADLPALQEALVAMFKWYQSSALTIVFLCDVHSPPRRGDLTGSIWNSRAWTYQEYHASKVVWIYTKDWRLYMNLDSDIPNHKESPEIILEMEKATGLSARTLVALQPGLDNIREKLFLASKRQTSRVEDSAYSLFGIFSISLPVNYGEREEALGRLLAQLLTNSGNTNILAWTGKPGSFNSCLPANISVFDQLQPPHIPPVVTSMQMEMIIANTHTTSLKPALVKELYSKLCGLRAASFSAKRMALPCLAFNVKHPTVTRNASGYVLCAETDALGIVEITMAEDLSQFDALIIVHPWIDFLLNRQPIGETTPSGESLSSQGPSNMQAPQSGVTWFPPGWWPFSSPAWEPQDLWFVARLRQPFGALLFAQIGRTVVYKRVAADSMITVQVQEDIPLSKLIDNTRMLDVL